MNEQLFEIDLTPPPPIVKITKPKKVKPTEKHVYAYWDKNDYPYPVSFFVATSYGNCKYKFCQEMGIDFDEMGEHSVKIYRCFDKYIREKDTGEIDMFFDPYWVKALYELGGYLEKAPGWEDDEVNSRNLSLEEAIKCAKDYDIDESVVIVLPQTVKKNEQKKILV